MQALEKTFLQSLKNRAMFFTILKQEPSYSSSSLQSMIA